MRVIMFFLITGLLLCFSCRGEKAEKAEKTESQPQPDEQTVMVEKMIYYTCPMDEHKKVHSDQPGKCPECGMDLVAAVTTSPDSMDFYGCPMLSHSHIRQMQPGDCPECGMKLQPMRLKKTL